MRLHPVERLHEELVDRLQHFEDYGTAVDFYLTIGDEDITHRFSSGKLTCGGSEVCWKLDAVVTERLSLRQRNAPVRLQVDIDGITMTSLYAKVSLPVPNADHTTQLLAATPGALLDKVSLKQFTQYDHKTPQWVIRDAAHKIKYYDRNRITIPHFDTPLIVKTKDDAFEDETTPKQVMDHVAPLVDCVFYDTQLGGLRVIENPGTGEGQEVAWTFATDSPEVVEFNGMTWATPDEQITEVVVRKRLEDPMLTNGTGPDGRYQIYYEWPVDYSELENPPSPNQTMWIPFEYDPNVDDPVEKQLEARQLAFKNARDLSNGLWTGSIKVSFNHLLEPGDVIIIEEDDQDDEGRYYRTWRCVIESVSWDISESNVSTTFDLKGVLQRELRVREPTSPLVGISPGNIAAGNTSQYLGFDVTGMWIDPAFALPIENQEWMVDEGSYAVWIDPDPSGGRAGVDATGLYLEDGLGL